MSNQQNPDSQPIHRGDAPSPASGTIAGSSIVIAGGVKVDFANFQSKDGQGYDYTTNVVVGGKKTRVTADLDDGDKTIEVVINGNEEYVQSPVIHEKIVAAQKAIASGNFTKEEAAALAAAQAKLTGSMKGANFDDTQTSNIMKAYDDVIKEGQKGR